MPRRYSDISYDTGTQLAVTLVMVLSGLAFTYFGVLPRAWDGNYQSAVRIGIITYFGLPWVGVFNTLHGYAGMAALAFFYVSAIALLT